MPLCFLRWKMTWLYILLGIIALTLIAVVVASLVLFNFAIARHDKATAEKLIQNMKNRYKDDKIKKTWGYKIEEGYNKFLKLPVKDVYMNNRDGMKLRGYLVETEGATKTVIFSHGWRSMPLFDFSCIWDYYLDHKFNVLIIEHRANRESEGKYIYFGVKERFDIIDWANWTIERYGSQHKIFLSGISMGSAAVMMAVGTEGLPENVVGASCDCGYTSAADIFKHVLKKGFHLPPFPILHVAGLISKLLAKFDFEEFTSTEGVKNAKIPLLFIHGTADGFVPVEHTNKNIEACASEHVDVIVEGAEHGLSFFTDPDAVIAGLESILKKVFPDFE